MYSRHSLINPAFPFPKIWPDNNLMFRISAFDGKTRKIKVFKMLIKYLKLIFITNPFRTITDDDTISTLGIVILYGKH